MIKDYDYYHFTKFPFYERLARYGFRIFGAVLVLMFIAIIKNSEGYITASKVFAGIAGVLGFIGLCCITAAVSWAAYWRGRQLRQELELARWGNGKTPYYITLAAKKVREDENGKFVVISLTESGLLKEEGTLGWLIGKRFMAEGSECLITAIERADKWADGKVFDYITLKVKPWGLYQQLDPKLIKRWNKPNFVNFNKDTSNDAG